MKIQLRDYQKEAINWAYNNKLNKCVVQLQTRLGKSVLIKELARKFSEDGCLVLVLTETSSLIDQLDKHLSINEKPNIIKAGKHRTTDSNIWLVMEQSFHKDSNFRKEFELLIAFSPVVVLRDEISKGYRGDRFNEIINFLQPERIIGFDATPIDQYARAIMPKKQIKEFYSTQKAIEAGYWKKPIYIIPKEVKNIDLSEIKISSTGDYITSELSETMQDEVFINTVLKNTNKKYPNKKWIVYCVDIAHAEMVTKIATEIFNSVGIVHSKIPDKNNEEIIKRFKEEAQSDNSLMQKEPIQVLVSVMSLTIGFDAPIADGIINFRPTKVLKLWRQFGSRANTPYPEKDKAYIIDAGMCTQRLGFLEEPLLVLEQNTSTKEAREALNTLDRTKVISYMQLEDKELKFENIELYEQQYKKETTNIYKMKLENLINLFKIETDFWKILEIATEIWNRINDKQYSWKWIKKQTEEAFDYDKYSYKLKPLAKKLKNRARLIIKGEINAKFGSLPYWIDYMLNKFEHSYIYKESIYEKEDDSSIDILEGKNNKDVIPGIDIDENEIPF